METQKYQQMIRVKDRATAPTRETIARETKEQLQAYQGLRRLVLGKSLIGSYQRNKNNN